MSQPIGNSFKSRLLALLLSPAFIVFVICLVLMSYNLVHTYKFRPFSSDDVFWQTILQTWHPFNGDKVTLGNSSVYVDKLPYYALFSHFFEPSRKLIFLEASIAGLAGFSTFYWSSLYFLKRFLKRLDYSTLLPFVWLTSIGYVFSSLYLNPNWRGFQIGISMAAFAGVAAVWWGDIKFKSRWSKFILLLASAYAGLQIYSDPYFLYFTIGPVVILSAVLIAVRRIDRRQLLPVAIPVVLSLVFAKLFGALSAAAGVRTTTGYDMQFVQFDNLSASFGSSIHNILIIFNADFFGRKLDLLTAGVLLNCALVGYILYKVYASLLKGRRANWKDASFDKVWPVFFLSVCLLIFLAHTFSTQGQGTATYRYFLMLALLSIVILALVIGNTRNSFQKSLLSAILIIATLSNLAFTAFGNQDINHFEVADNRANILNYSIRDMLRSRGYDKGYANYWDASISTYLSGGNVTFLPSVCTGRQAAKWHWLINDRAFDKKAGRSFLWIDPDVPAACSPKNMIRQFGKPQDILRIGDKTIFLYNYDIGPKMGSV